MASIAGLHTSESCDPLPFPIRRFTVVEYEEMGRLGILGEDDKVELLEGLIVNLVDRRLEVYSQLSGDQDERFYTRSDSYSAAQQVPLTIAAQTVAHLDVADLLP